MTELSRRTLLRAAGTLSAAAAAAPVLARQTPAVAPVIDVHTHMFTKGWVDTLRANPDKDTRLVKGSRFEEVDYRGQRIVRMSPEMTDFDLRIRNMDAAGVDMALISLTTPSVFIGDERISVKLANAVNDDFADAQTQHPRRLRWFSALPWQYPDAAIREMRRTRAKGAIGIGTTTNIAGKALTDPLFAPIWREIEATGTPVFIHPTTPYVDVSAMGMGEHGLANTVGFTADTSLCFMRMILDGFLDRYPKLELIACHGGGTMPYLAARFDQMWQKGSSNRKIANPPSSYFKRLWFDSIVYDQATLAFLVEQVGVDRVLYGSDYPFLIGDMKGVLDRVDRLPAEQARAVRSGNAQRLFKL
ncbi:amidohydrolase family protein [Sphingomonas baiyangensis]|uniref:Amidohydrolase n=1 Tax=Sphingomonas baiyangensis TaxID=2572576 RepID=A0A4U1KZL6_9SPHN|nr:amidohydrolase family protein [Sphingomonas baiyangensis]TKD49881.1 amidohydrolase [Sphingomonas baiyangensis]